MKKKLLLFGVAVIIGVTLILNANSKVAYAAQEDQKDEICLSSIVCDDGNGHHYAGSYFEGYWYCCSHKDSDRGCKEGSGIPPQG